MSIITGILGFLQNLDSFLLVMIVFLILGLVFKSGIKTSLKSAVMVGAGVLAISTVSSMMVSYLTPLADNLVNNAGINNDVIDVSIAPVFGACISLPFFIFLYPIGLAVNYLLIKLKWTKTLNVDFLDLFAILIPFVPFYIITGNVVLTLVFSIIYYAISLKITDLTAKYYQSFFGLEGISISHPHDTFRELYTLGINWVFDHIPGINKIDFAISDISKKFTLLGNPSFLSFVIGVVLGLISKSGLQASLGIGVAMAATCLLFPKAVGLIMEGVRPIANNMKNTVQKKLAGAEIWVGMDSAILTGYPESVAVGAILIPLCLAEYFLLPGIRIIPSGESLAGLAQTAGVVLPLCGTKTKKGNAFRAIVSTLIFEAVVLYLATWISPVVTDFCASTGMMEVPAGTLLTSSILGHPISGLVTWITQLFH